MPKLIFHLISSLPFTWCETQATFERSYTTSASWSPFNASIKASSCTVFHYANPNCELSSMSEILKKNVTDLVEVYCRNGCNYAFAPTVLTTITPPIQTSWGVWYNWAYCLQNQLAYGYQLKVQDPISGDNTAVNAIRLLCAYPPESGKPLVTTIRSGEGPDGTWKSPVICNSTFFTGAKVLSQPNLGLAGDDTATNDLAMWCGNQYLTGTGDSWGTWGAEAMCPGQSQICGISTQIENPQGSGDDSALNGIQLACCVY